MEKGVTSAMSAPTAGRPALVARAAHGEALSKDGTAILYADIARKPLPLRLG